MAPMAPWPHYIRRSWQRLALAGHTNGTMTSIALSRSRPALPASRFSPRPRCPPLAPARSAPRRNAPQGRGQGARGALTVARQEGIAEGQAVGMRDSLRRILELRGIPLTADEQHRLSRCADVEVLDRWLQKALTASTAAQLFE